MHEVPRRGRPPGVHTGEEKAGGEPREPRRKIFTPELAGRINSLVRNYPGTTMLSNLRLAPPSTQSKNFEVFGFSPVTSPPEGWEPFYLGREEASVKLDVIERKNVSTALKIAMETGFASVQQIRDATIAQLMVGIPGSGLPLEFRRSHLTVETAAFLKKAFQPPVEPGAGNK